MKGLIVVGVDGSEESKAALRFAVDEARLRGLRLRVVHAWFAYPAIADGMPVVPEDWAALGETARTFVEQFVAEVAAEHEGVELEAAAVHGTAANVLVDESRVADLLVVGSRGHGGFTGLLLGSVSQQCVHHAACPVVVVRNVPVQGGAGSPLAAAAGR